MPPVMFPGYKYPANIKVGYNIFGQKIPNFVEQTSVIPQLVQLQQSADSQVPQIQLQNLDATLMGILNQAKASGLVSNKAIDTDPEMHKANTKYIVDNTHSSSNSFADHSVHIKSGGNIVANNVGEGSVIWLNNILLI